MNRLLSIVLLFLAISPFFSCTKETDTELSITTTELFFTKNGGSQSISFKSNKDWTATSSADWVKVTPSGSSGDQSISINVDANPEYDDRSATITIKVADLTRSICIRQSYATGILISKNEYAIMGASYTIEIKVEANVDFEVESEVDWITPVKSKAMTLSTILLNVAKNETLEKRVGKVYVRQKNGDKSEVITISQRSGQESQRSGPFFSKGVELMCLIWKLAGAPEFNQCQVSEVNQSIQSYFAPVLSHNAVELAKEYREQNIAYDAVTAFGLHLKVSENGSIIFNPNYVEYPDDSFFLRWSPQQREAMLAAVNDFYQKSGFDEWYDSLEPLFQEAITAFSKVCDVDYSWYDSFFGTIENPSTQIILSFLIGLNNNGLSVLQKDGQILSSPVMGSILENQSGELYYGDILDIIIHEFCHPYCNPLISEYWDSMEGNAYVVYSMVSGKMTAQAYGSPKTMMCETFVRSSVIHYLISHCGYSKTSLVKEQESLGFLLVGLFVDQLELREENRNQYPTMNEFMPEIVQAVDDYCTTAYSDNYDEYDNPSAPNLLPGKFSVGPNSKVQFTKSNIYWDGTTLRFESNPMNYPTVWNPSHVGHFFWATTLEASVAAIFDEGKPSLTDHFFCDGSDENHTLTVEGISGLRVLDDYEDGEIDYLLNRRRNASQLFKFPVMINGVGACLVLAPDNYSGYIADAYDAASWIIAENKGLVCLSPNGVRQDTGLWECSGRNGAYWCGNPKEDNPAYAYHLAFIYGERVYHNPSYSPRFNGFPLRLVKDVE